MNNQGNENVSTTIPSITSLHKEKNVKEKSKGELFTIVLNKCIEKILYTNRHTDKTYVIFEVPKIMIGYPFYDMKMCILFLIKALSENSYYVYFLEPFYIYIDWGSNPRTSVQPTEKLKRQTKELLERFPNTHQVKYVYADQVTSKNNKKNQSKK